MAAGHATRGGKNIPRQWFHTRAAGFAATVLAPVVHLSLTGSSDWWPPLLGSLPGAAAGYAIWTYLAKRKFHRLPFLEFSLLQIYIMWGMPALTLGAHPTLPTGSTGQTTALLAVLLLLAFAWPGYWLGWRTGMRLQPIMGKVLPSRLDRPAMIVLAPLLILGMLVNSNLHGALLPPELKNTVQIIGGYAPPLVFIAYRVLEPGTQWPRWPLYGAVLLVSFAGLTTGHMSAGLMPLLTVGAVYLMVRHRVPWRWVVACIGLMILLQPAKMAYRAITSKQGATRDFETSAKRWAEAISDKWSGRDQTESNLSQLSSRLDELSSLSTAIALCPGVVPHDNGRMWKYIPLSLVPRFLYPEKPNLKEVLNDRYNLAFGLQPAATMGVTTMAFPLLADGYWNFGWLGVALVGIILGFLLGILSNGVPPTTWSGITVGLVLLTKLNARAPLTELIASSIQRLIGVTVVCWFIWGCARLLAGKGRA